MQIKSAVAILIIISTFTVPLQSRADLVDNQLAKNNLDELRIIAQRLKKVDKRLGKTILKTRRKLSKARKGRTSCELEVSQKLFPLLEDVSGIIQKKACSNNEERTFTPKVRHCKSAADLECVCSHKQHRKEERCKPFVKDKSNKGKKGKCIDDTELEQIVLDYENIITSLKNIFLKDEDGDGTTDICQDNL